jgi:hypothetical protein
LLSLVGVEVFLRLVGDPVVFFRGGRHNLSFWDWGELLKLKLEVEGVSIGMI